VGKESSAEENIDEECEDLLSYVNVMGENQMADGFSVWTFHVGFHFPGR
jgi:hypothetical protein